MATTADNKTAVVWGLGSETSNQLTAFDGDTGRQLYASAAVPGVCARATLLESRSFHLPHAHEHQPATLRPCRPLLLRCALALAPASITA